MYHDMPALLLPDLASKVLQSCNPRYFKVRKLGLCHLQIPAAQNTSRKLPGKGQGVSAIGPRPQPILYLNAVCHPLCALSFVHKEHQGGASTGMSATTQR